jgi:hypothetical protein
MHRQTRPEILPESLAVVFAEAINKSPQLLTNVDLCVLIFFFPLIFEERSSDLSKSV